MWDYESVWQKSRVFMRRAIDEDNRDGDVFPLWSSFAIELLCRASLAKIHPSLLADPREGPDNILHACGFPTKLPRSIPMKTVLSRCQKICPGFTEREATFCGTIAERRNEDLHSGAMPFASLEHSDWLGDFYRICKILLDQQGKTLADFLGSSEADVAQDMIAAIAADRKAEANRMVKEAKKLFDTLPIEKRLELIRDSETLRKGDYQEWGKVRDVECPACEGAARINAKIVSESKPRDEDGELVQVRNLLPIKLKCYACSLSINGHEFLHALGLGSQFQFRFPLDPVDHFGIEPSDYGWMDEDTARNWLNQQEYDNE